MLHVASSEVPRYRSADVQPQASAARRHIRSRHGHHIFSLGKLLTKQKEPKRETRHLVQPRIREPTPPFLHSGVLVLVPLFTSKRLVKRKGPWPRFPLFRQVYPNLPCLENQAKVHIIRGLMNIFLAHDLAKGNSYPIECETSSFGGLPGFPFWGRVKPPPGCAAALRPGKPHKPPAPAKLAPGTRVFAGSRFLNIGTCPLPKTAKASFLFVLLK